jgi:putative transposase
MMQATEKLAQCVGLKRACDALGTNRAALYRRRDRQASERSVRPRPQPPLKLSEEERQTVLELMHSERFIDASPHTLYATLLDEGHFHCSVRTMYRLLEEEGELRERRNQRRHPQYTKPELLATAPNQLWSWDITKLKGPAKWTYFYLYVILDVFSRCVVGWMVATRESAALAEKLIRETCTKQGVERGQLTLHADRGSSMTSKPVAFLLADLGVTKTHSRPHVSNDNPFSEAQFKTLKYRPTFPTRFGSLEDARAFCRPFFHWYNTEHRHSGIAFMTPESVHYGRAPEIMQVRSKTLEAQAVRQRCCI